MRHNVKTATGKKLIQKELEVRLFDVASITSWDHPTHPEEGEHFDNYFNEYKKVNVKGIQNCFVPGCTSSFKGFVERMKHFTVGHKEEAHLFPVKRMKQLFEKDAKRNEAWQRRYYKRMGKPFPISYVPFHKREFKNSEEVRAKYSQNQAKCRAKKKIQNQQAVEKPDEIDLKELAKTVMSLRRDMMEMKEKNVTWQNQYAQMNAKEHLEGYARMKKTETTHSSLLAHLLRHADKNADHKEQFKDGLYCTKTDACSFKTTSLKEYCDHCNKCLGVQMV